MTKLRYSEFSDRIDIDSLEAAIGFDMIREDKGNDIGHCPDWWGLHANGDQTGKFAIHREKLVYNCWVCGGGSLLDLAMNHLEFQGEDGSSEAATYWLYQLTKGDTRDDDEFTQYLLDLIEDTEERVETLPYFNPRSLDQFDGPRDWFYERGITDEVIEAHGLGTHMTYHRAAPRKNGEKIDDDYVGPVAIFPHFWQHRLVGWQHRWIDWDPEVTPRWLAKWINTSDFPKHTTVFNFDNALKAEGPIVVAESVATVLFLESCGVPAVSTFGAEANEAQLRLLRRFQLGVVLCPDNDIHGAGLRAAESIGRYLQRFIPVYFLPSVNLPKKGADLGDFASTDDPYDALMGHLEKRQERFLLD